MIKPYFKTVFRNIKKDVYQSSLNIIGLALGFAAAIFIIIYVNNENSFDTFHSKADRIYRVVTDVKMGDTEESLTNSENPLAIAVKNDLPEVEAATRLFFNKNQLLKVGDKKFVEEKLWYADENFFEVFDFEIIKGDKLKSLSEPYSIVVTENFGKKYFGEGPLIGKSIEIGVENTSYKITGVLKNIPKNSHIQFEAIASYRTLPVFKRIGSMDWGNFMDLYTYILLKKNTDFEPFRSKFKKLPKKYYGTMMQKNMGISFEEFEQGGNFVNHELQPLKEIHLDKTYIDDIHVYGNKQMLHILTIIGILIIIIASFNFINLATARASLKAKEIGIKKVLGSSKKIIILQVLSESFIICILALIVSALILIFLTPILNLLSGLELSFVDFMHLPVILVVVFLPIVISVFAGLFPAIVISRYNPIEVMKNRTKNSRSFSLVRSWLVGVQFVVFIILVVGTISVRKQLLHLRNYNPGFNKENVLVIRNSNKLGNGCNAYKNEFKKYTSVINASYTSGLPSRFDGSSNPFSKPDDDHRIFLNRLYVDADFINTLKIDLAGGRFFSEKLNEEKGNAVINEKAAKLLGWSDCNGKIIYDYNDGGNNYNVIGIVKDFHLGSLKYEQYPAILRVTGNAEYLALRIQPGSAKEVIEKAKSSWEEMNKSDPFEYFFLDNAFDAQYKSEERLSNLVALFSGISIIIACFGLLGLISFASVRRQKEIGIRKVNGAKIHEIITMLNRALVITVFIAFIIAVPLAWYIMNKWLESFAYKTDLNWWIFALSGLLALAITLLTVSWQTWRAARRNPIDALRYE